MDPLIGAGVAVGKELIKKTSFYDDGLRPVVKETGKALGTIGKAVNMCLSPLAGIIWGYDKVCKYVEKRVSEKLQSVPPEQIQTPKANIAVPTIEGIRTVSDEPVLRELYASLLASSMDKATASGVHPAFAKAIAEMSPDEAKILATLVQEGAYPTIDLNEENQDGRGYVTIATNFSDISWKAGAEYPHMVSTYLENLERLKIIEISVTSRLKDDNLYTDLEQHPAIEYLIRTRLTDQNKKKFTRRFIRLTCYGTAFCKACDIT